MLSDIVGLKAMEGESRKRKVSLYNHTTHTKQVVYMYNILFLLSHND